MPLPSLGSLLGENYMLRPQLERRIYSALAGGALGYGLGELSQDPDDPDRNPWLPAIAGATLGAVGTRPSRIAQLPILDEALRSNAERFGLQKAAPRSLFDWKTRQIGNYVRNFEPIYQAAGHDPMAIANINTRYGGGTGAFLADEHDLIQPLLDLEQRGLQDPLKEYLLLQMGRTGWRTLGDQRAELYSQMTERLGAGDHTAAAALRDQISAIEGKMRSGDVAYAGPDELGLARKYPGDLENALAAFQTAHGPENFGRIKSVADQLYNKSDAIVDQMFQKGMIEPQEYEQWVARRRDGYRYIPSYRDVLDYDEGAGVLRFSPRSRTIFDRQRRGLSQPNLDNILAKLTGSAKTPYGDPLENAMWFLQESHKNIQRQEAAQKTVEHLLGMGYGAEPRPDLPAQHFTIEKMFPGQELGPQHGAISFMREGQAERYKVPIEYADVFNVAENADISRGLKVLGAMQRFNARLITAMSPRFIVPNLFRDTEDAMMLSNVNPVDYAKHWGEAMKTVIRDEMTEDRKLFYEFGGAMSGLARNLAETPVHQRHIAHSETPLQHAFSKVQDTLNVAEEGTKLAVFSALRRSLPEELQNNPDAIRLLASHVRQRGGSPDFGQWGSKIKDAGTLFQFLNPRIQGITRTLEVYKNDPMKFVRTLGAITMGLFALDSWNHSQTHPENGDDAMNYVPPQEQQGSIVILTGGWDQTSSGTLTPSRVRIPLGHAAQLIVQPLSDAFKIGRGEHSAPSGAQAVANAAANVLPLGNPIDVENPIGSAATGVAASANPAIRWVVEQLANKSSFANVPIVGQRIAGNVPAEQFTADTTPTAKNLAHLVDKIPGFDKTWFGSPARMEHTLRTFLPGAGEMLLSTLDYNPKGTEGEMEGYGKLPGVGPIAKPFMGTNQDAMKRDYGTEFYEAAEKTQQWTQTLGNMRLSNPVRFEQLMQDPRIRQLRALNAPMQRIGRYLGHLGRLREHIANDPSLDPATKRAKIREIYQAESQILRGQAQSLVVLVNNLESE